MTGYNFRAGQPAIRSATRSNPWTCPWCGEDTWLISDGDVRGDRARVQMYCDSTDCVSRETELIIMRGDGANNREDVRALAAIDSGGDAVAQREGQAPPYRFKE